MINSVAKMLAELKSIGIAASKAESDLEFSNGLLGKAAKGTCSLSADKYSKLWNYHVLKMVNSKIPELKVASEIISQPIIDKECRQVKDYCKENGIAVSELIEFHESAKTKVVEKIKTVRQKKEEERSVPINETYIQKRNRLKNQ